MHYLGANRIQLDVAVTGEQVALLLNGARLETAFPERSGTPVTVMI